MWWLSELDVKEDVCLGKLYCDVLTKNNCPLYQLLILPIYFIFLSFDNVVQINLDGQLVLDI